MGKTTQLHQGSLNGLRRQTNECLENAYKRGFEDGTKWAIDENAKDHQGYYDKGYNNALEDLDHALDVLKSMTGTECAEWFEDCVGVDEVVCGFTAQRIVEITKAYEEKKKAEEEIKVGDEVNVNGDLAIVTRINPNDYDVFYFDGMTGEPRKTDCEKTGRHFEEITQLLDKLRKEEVKVG